MGDTGSDGPVRNGSGTGGPGKGREARLKAALRANLARRKAQARQRDALPDGRTGPGPDDGGQAPGRNDGRTGSTDSTGATAPETPTPGRAAAGARQNGQT